MSKNIHVRLYIKFILKVLIFGVGRHIIHIYNDTSRDNSVVRVSNRYVRK